jgi:hypothetical protein
MSPDSVNNTAATNSMGPSLREEFSGIDIGPLSHFRNLTLFPLIRRHHIEKPDYLLLEDAIARRLGRVTEIHEGGSVPELRFENSSELPVLLLDGEELIGAKQNRVLNLTILAPAKQTTVIPVSCVEAGRWSMSNAAFRSSDNVMYSRARARKVSDVTLAMRANESRRSDQSAVWDEIAAKMERLDAASPTRAMSALYERQATSVEEYVRAFQPQQGQAGVAFAINGSVFGLDLFDNEEVLRRFFAKLVRSFVLDAIDAAFTFTNTPKAPRAGDPARREAVVDFLAEAASAPSSVPPAVGLGKDIRFVSSAIAGAGLWAQERYIHICAFAHSGQNNSGAFQTRISRPARRQRS